jgi:hypothetical protein
MSAVGFKPTISVLERAKTVRALDRAATAIGRRTCKRTNSTVTKTTQWKKTKKELASRPKRRLMRTYFWISLFTSYRITANELIESNVILIANKEFNKKKLRTFKNRTWCSREYLDKRRNKFIVRICSSPRFSQNFRNILIFRARGC